MKQSGYRSWMTRFVLKNVRSWFVWSFSSPTVYRICTLTLFDCIVSHFSKDRGGAKLNPLAYGGSTGGGLAVLRGAIDEVVVVVLRRGAASGRCILFVFAAMALLLLCGCCTVLLCLRVDGVIGAAAREVAAALHCC